MACAVARAHSHGDVQHPHPQDLLLQPGALPVAYTDILITTECGPWSQASGPVPPGGFNDPRAELFVKACRIVADQTARNPRVNILFENVDIHPALAKTDGPEQERLLSEQFHVVALAVLLPTWRLLQILLDANLHQLPSLLVQSIPLCTPCTVW